MYNHRENVFRTAFCGGAADRCNTWWREIKLDASLRKNFILNSMLTLSGLIFPFLMFQYGSRILGPSGTGRVFLARSVTDCFLALSQMGIPVYALRTCAALRNDKHRLALAARELLCLSLIMCFVSSLLFGLALLTLPRLKEDSILCLVTGSSIWLNALGVEWLYRALEEYRTLTLRSVFFRLAALPLMVMWVRTDSDCLYFALAMVIASCGACIPNLLLAGRYLKDTAGREGDQYRKDPAPGEDGQYRKNPAQRKAGRKPELNIRQHVRPVMVFFAMAAATTVYNSLDTVMLGFISSDAQTGYYTAAVRIKLVLVGMITSLVAVLLPRVSFYAGSGRMDEIRRLAKRALLLVFVLTLPIAAILTVYAPWAISFVSGSGYGGAVTAMRFTMPQVVLIGLTHIMGMQIMIPLGREKTVLYSVLAGAAVDVAGNLLLIPQYGAAGAAGATLAAETVVFLFQSSALLRRGHLTNHEY